MPTALETPTGAEPGQDGVPHIRLDAAGDGVTVWTAIAGGEEVKEDDRRGDSTQNEEASENHKSQDRFQHGHLLQALLDLRPLLDVCHPVLDTLDDDFRSHR